MKLKKVQFLWVKNLKHIFNEISQEMGFICPEYKTIESKITRDINKQLPPNSHFQVKIFMKYNEDIFVDGTFYIFNNTIITQKNFHCDFEKVNNASESFKNYLNNIFSKKAFFL
ncbi:hypothetical protein U3516DRAFT_772111 [Neocallimastix sp. 'constans']